MTALYLLLVAAVWIALAALLAYAITSRIEDKALRLFLALGFAALLLPLPLIDEIVGKRQFEQLCKDNATIKIDREAAAGKFVYLDPSSRSNVQAMETWVPIVLRPVRFVEINSRETIVSYTEVLAAGGRLQKLLGLSEGGVPLLFNGTCVPASRPGSAKDFELLGINYVEPPTVNKP